MGRVNHAERSSVLIPGQRPGESEGNFSRWPIAVLGDAAINQGSGTIRRTALGGQKQHAVGVLFDLPRVSQVGEPRFGIGAVLALSVELTQNDNGNREFASEELQPPREESDLCVPVLALVIWGE